MADATGWTRPGSGDAHPASLTTRAPQLAEAHRFMSDTEMNFHRVVHYLAGVLWAKGAGPQALAALHDALATAESTHRTVEAADALRPHR